MELELISAVEEVELAMSGAWRELFPTPIITIKAVVEPVKHTRRKKKALAPMQASA